MAIVWPCPWSVERYAAAGCVPLVLHETVEADGTRVVRALCPRGDDRLISAVEDRDAGHELATTVAQALLGRSDSWSLSLGPVPHDDHFLKQLHTHLPKSRLVAGAAIPMIAPPTGHACSIGSGCPYLTLNMQRNLRKARNRLASDGQVANIRAISDPQEMDPWLERVWQLRRDRDASVGRARPDPHALNQRFWCNSLSAHARVGAAELSPLEIGGQLAAYIVGFTDGSAYRVLEGRFASGLARYNPGRLLEADVAHRAVCHQGRHLDWMNAVAPDKLVAATSLEQTRWWYASA